MKDVSTHGCFHRLIDDAAIFPPGNSPIDRAVSDHHDHCLSAYAPLVGPLLVRDSDVAGLAALTDRPLEIGIIGTSGPEGLDRALAISQRSSMIAVSAVEIPVPTGGDVLLATNELVTELLSLPAGVTVSVELPRPGGEQLAAWAAAAEEIAAAGLQIKLRTGGVVADAHPAEDELATALAAVVPHRFKLTAGLHRAVRNTQPETGFEQHGFLNILVAVHLLAEGSTAERAAEVLRERDGRALASAVRAWSDQDTAVVRQTFRGFGSCSVTEPYADLLDLELIA